MTRKTLLWVALSMTVGCMGCGPRVPTGMLGLGWGMPAAAAAARLGGTCTSWAPWPDGTSHQRCRIGPVKVLGAVALKVYIVSRDGALAGLVLNYAPCPRPDLLAEAVARELSIDREYVEYTSWSTGEVVRLEQGTQQQCHVTVSDAVLGKRLSAHWLGQGLMELGNAFRPR